MSLKKLWQDECGFVVSTDLIFTATIVVLGLVVGLVALRDQVAHEFGDVATALGRLDQSYEYTGCESDPDNDDYYFVAGSNYTDESDFCEEGDEKVAITVAEPREEGQALQ